MKMTDEAGFAAMAGVGVCFLGGFFGTAAIDRARGDVEPLLTEEMALLDSSSARKLNPDAYIVDYSGKLRDSTNKYPLERQAFESTHPNLKILAVLDSDTDLELQKIIKGLDQNKIQNRQLVFCVTQRAD